jgi:hypothetical protein
MLRMEQLAPELKLSLGLPGGAALLGPSGVLTDLERITPLNISTREAVVGQFVDRASVVYEQTKSAFRTVNAGGTTWLDQEPLGGVASASEWSVAYAGDGQREYTINSQVLAFSTLVPTRTRVFTIDGLEPAWTSNDQFTSTAYDRTQAAAYGTHRATAPQVPGAVVSSPAAQLPRLEAPASSTDPLLDFRRQTQSLAAGGVASTQSRVVSRDQLTGETITETFTNYRYDWTSILNDLMDDRRSFTYEAVTLPEPIIEYQPVISEVTQLVSTSSQFIQPLSGVRKDYAIRLAQPDSGPPDVEQRATATQPGGTVRARRVLLNGQQQSSVEVQS